MPLKISKSPSADINDDKSTESAVAESNTGKTIKYEPKRVQRQTRSYAENLPLDKDKNENIENAFKSGNGLDHSDSQRLLCGSITPDDVEALCSLDSVSSNLARLYDTLMYHHTFQFPRCFPWYSPSMTLLPTIPRDIEELPGIIYGDHDFMESLPPTVTNGRRGFRNISSWKYSKTPGYNIHYRAAVRRSNDPGVLDLWIQTKAIDPSPPWERNRNVLLAEGIFNESLSSMPWHWSSRYCYGEKNWSDVDSYNDEMQSFESEPKNPSEEHMMKMLGEEILDKAKNKFLSRHWKVSVKVAGVSTRSTIIGNKDTLDYKGGTTSHDSLASQRCKIATYPSFIQTGKTLNFETAATSDQKDGYGSFLGLYDVFLSPILHNTIRNSRDYLRTGTHHQPPRHNLFHQQHQNKNKRVFVGRTRIIWSQPVKMSWDDKQADLSSNKKVVFKSLITGCKMESSAYKRPKITKVVIAVSGKRMFFEASSSSSSNAVNCLSPISPISISRDATLLKNRSNPEDEQERKKGPKKLRLRISLQQKSCDTSKKQTTIFYDGYSEQKKKKPIWQNNVEINGKRQQNNKAAQATCSLDRREYLDVLIPSTKRRKMASPACYQDFNSSENLNNKNNASQDSYVAMKYGATTALKCKAPIFSVIPLEDGHMRVVCLMPGSLNGCGIHSIIGQAARKCHGEPVCSICWTNQTQVQECIDCGLLAHPSCCLDRGQMWTMEDGYSQDSEGLFKTNQTAKDENEVMWRCAVCYHYRKKSTNLVIPIPLNAGVKTSTEPASKTLELPARKKLRRASKMPSRYNSESSVSTDVDIQQQYPMVKKNSKTTHKYRPSWKCTLCPHAGGAMSMDAFATSNNNSKWSHEVCRIWSGFYRKTKTMSPSSNFSTVCVICGMSGGGIIRCAAHGCSITFHPYCALLMTKLRVNDVDPNGVHENGGIELGNTRMWDSNDHNEYMEAEINRDNILCNQYSLQLLEVSRMENMYGSIPGIKKSSVVPVALCGLHNPNRIRSLYGCLPCGEDAISHVMRVPTIQKT